MPFFGRIGRPGLLGTAARTAVIAGTAAATAGAVRRRQVRRYQADSAAQELAAQQQEEQQQELAQQAAAQQYQAMNAQAAPPAPAPAAASGTDLVAKLKQLAELHDSGALTDEEFAAAKAKLVG